MIHDLLKPGSPIAPLLKERMDLATENLILRARCEDLQGMIEREREGSALRIEEMELRLEQEMKTP